MNDNKKNRTITIFHYLKENYTVSYSVILMFKYYGMMKDYFQSKGWKVMYITDYIENQNDYTKITNLQENMKLSDEQINEIYQKAILNFIQRVKDTNELDNSYAIGHHPKGYDPLFTEPNYKIFREKGLKLLLWQDDLHHLWRNQNKTWTDEVSDRRFDRTDVILSPSKKFYQNLQHPYLSKTEFYFYCFNENFFNKLPVNNFFKRKNKIILTGAVGYQYPLRNQIYNFWRWNKESGRGFSKYIDVFNHPGYDRHKNGGRTGLDYYKLLNGYKGAFMAYLVHPINYPVAKIVEILACGTLGFFQYDKVLDEMGLVRFKHYVPIKMDNLGKMDMDEKYYLKYLTTQEGEKIAAEGCKFVREKFTMKKKADELIRILEKN